MAINGKWDSKQARDLFCKCVNSLLMTDPKRPLEDALRVAETVVNKAFELYSSREKQEEFDFPEEKTIEED